MPHCESRSSFTQSLHGHVHRCDVNIGGVVVVAVVVAAVSGGDVPVDGDDDDDSLASKSNAVRGDGRWCAGDCC